jgi:hypothetical protein
MKPSELVGVGYGAIKVLKRLSEKDKMSTFDNSLEFKNPYFSEDHFSGGIPARNFNKI